jgi:hypothetical protein
MGAQERTMSHFALDQEMLQEHKTRKMLHYLPTVDADEM